MLSLSLSACEGCLGPPSITGKVIVDTEYGSPMGTRRTLVTWKMEVRDMRVGVAAALSDPWVGGWAAGGGRRGVGNSFYTVIGGDKLFLACRKVGKYISVGGGDFSMQPRGENKYILLSFSRLHEQPTITTAAAATTATNNSFRQQTKTSRKVTARHQKERCLEHTTLLDQNAAAFSLSHARFPAT